MPGVTVGVYAGEQTAGTEVSSTYEGRHITLLETELIHPFHADGLVDAGDQVLICNAGVVASYGRAVGVALTSATAITDYIAVDTEGIWNLTVFSYTDGGVGSAIVAGDPLFIHDESLGALGALGLGDGMLSKIRNTATQTPFGYALGTMVAAGTGQVAVKVHWDPEHDVIVGMFNTVTSGSFGWSFRGILTDGQSEGVSGYVQGDLFGTCTGLTYGFGSWLNLQAAYASGGFIHTPFEGGLWKGDADAALRAVFAGQYHAILAGAPASLHAWRLNVAAAAGPVTALIAAANPGSVGYAAGTAGTGVVGTIPLADVVGTGVVYVDVHGAIA